MQISDYFRPIFLPDPKDGSLYALGLGFEGFKKLPFTIPQLVSASPCKSTDGILYTGYKKDTWIAVDPSTGQKMEELSMEGAQKVCPSTSTNTIFIGRTEYSIVMYDSKTRERRWNATFMEFSSNAQKNLGEYDQRYFTSSSDGMIAAVDKVSGKYSIR